MKDVPLNTRALVLAKDNALIVLLFFTLAIIVTMFGIIVPFLSFDTAVPLLIVLFLVSSYIYAFWLEPEYTESAKDDRSRYA